MTNPLKASIQLVKFYLQKNYVKLFRKYRELPLLCQLAFHRKIPAIEKYYIHLNHLLTHKK